MKKLVNAPLRLALALALVLGLLPATLLAQDEPADIVDTAIAAGDFTTLVAAVQAAGLVDALKGEGPFTVFAPTDAAFASLPAGTVDALLADPQGDLTQILLYHVVARKVLAADVSDGLEAETLQGSPVQFSVQDGKVMINGANIVATDVLASNGVIHVIDSVILPPAAETAAAEAAPAQSDSDMAAGDMAAGDMAAGDMAAGDMADSDMAAGDAGEAPAPATMPVTGGESTPLLPLAIAGLALAALAGAAFVTSKRAA